MLLPLDFASKELPHHHLISCISGVEDSLRLPSFILPITHHTSLPSIPLVCPLHLASHLVFALTSDLRSVYTKLTGQCHTHWHPPCFTSSLSAQHPATLLWQIALLLCAPEACPLAALLWQLSHSNGEPLRELSLEPLFCSSLFGSPGPLILLSGFVFGLTVLSLTCQWLVFLLPIFSLPLFPVASIPSGFVMYV